MTDFGNVAWQECLTPSWQEVRHAFLEKVCTKQSLQVAELLRDGDARGRGLRMWLRHTATQGQAPLSAYPAELIQVYLDDNEALPLHDCGGCGIAIPVRPDWHLGDGPPQLIYFPRCPCCGGRTGLHAAWSQLHASVELTGASEASAACNR